MQPNQMSGSPRTGWIVTDFSYSRYIYFDTNIISHYVMDQSLWSHLFDFLVGRDLFLGIGEGQLAELADLKSHHLELVHFLLQVPSGVLVGRKRILEEEVASHPQRRTSTSLAYPIDAFLMQPNGPDELLAHITSDQLAESRRDQRAHARLMAARLEELKPNFPPSKSGRYTYEQANEFAQIQVMQWLAPDHRSFLEQFKSDVSGFVSEVFLSVRLFAYVFFYKYCIDNRKVKELSEFGDLLHLFSIPYSEIAVMERDLCNIMAMISKRHDVLDSTSVRNIEFIRKLHE